MTDLATTTPSDPAAVARLLGMNPNDPKTHAMVAVAQRYDLDPLLKHVVVIPGSGPYLTRDGLLHVAHRSGQFDGMVLESGPDLVDGEWRCVVSVYRKDMGRPFTFPGRYPANGGNRKYAPEMAIKVAECMALRRAFDVSGMGVLEEAEVGNAPQRQPEPQARPVERLATAHDPRWDANPAIAAGVVSGPAVSEMVDAMVVDETTGVIDPEPGDVSGEAPSSGPDYQAPPFVTPAGAPTKKQSDLMWLLLGKAYGDDVELKRAAISDALGRDVESTKTLTSREVSKVIDALKAAS